MNIDTYRAMKAKEAEKPNEEPEITEPIAETPVVTDPVVEDTPPVEETIPDKIVVDGEELTLEQIKEFRAGYSRTQDYTQKTQEAARIRRENQEAIELYEYMKANPLIAEEMLKIEQLSSSDKQRLAKLDPRTSDAARTERELNDLKLQRDIDRLSAQYEDFDVVKVLQTAYDKKMPNLEDAYKLVRGESAVQPVKVEAKKEDAVPFDAEAERARIRAEILQSMKDESNSTKTIISSNGGTPPSEKAEITLTPEQDRVRKKQGLTIEEYSKWRTR